MDTKITHELTYNEAMGQLNDIIEQIERGALDVDLLLELTEKAVHLISFCKDKLTKADLEIDKMLQRLNQKNAETGETPATSDDIPLF